MVNILLKKALGIVRSRGWSLLKAFDIFFIMSYLQDDGNYAEGRPEHRTVEEGEKKEEENEEEEKNKEKEEEEV